nr:hypothetical protein [Tanacetum cinerariifolium]
MDEALMGRVLHEFLLWDNCNTTLKKRYNTNLAVNLSKQIYSPFFVDWNILNTLACGNAIEDMLEVRVNEKGSDEFDEGVADDEMRKKPIKFRLCGKAYAMSILDFAKRLGYDKVQKNELSLFSVFEANHQNGFANIVTWLTAKLGVLSDEVVNGLSAPTYCRTLDADILRELIGSNGRLIPKEITHSISRVTTPMAPRPATSYLYDNISQLETRIGKIEMMMR